MTTRECVREGKSLEKKINNKRKSKIHTSQCLVFVILRSQLIIIIVAE